MSEVKEVGIVGQTYEDRTTGKIGVLESRDDKCKTLMMTDSDGKGFSISYSSFRSRWRKHTTEDVVTEVKPEVVEMKKVEPVAEAVEYVEVDPVKIIDEFNAENSGVTIKSISDNVYSFIKEDFEIMRVKQDKDSFAVVCLPDVYSIASAGINSCVSNFKCEPHKSGLDIRFILRMSFSNMLTYMRNALIGVNLYGYRWE